jgi:hypothetical protein
MNIVRKIEMKKLLMTAILPVMIVLCFSERSVAQQGTLRAGSTVISNGTNTITLVPPASGLTTYTWTLPSAQSASSTIQVLNSPLILGILQWLTPGATLNALGVVFSTGVPQQTATSGNYLFNLQSLKPGGGAINSTTPGAFISSVDGANSNSTGITINVGNTLASATGVTATGLLFDAHTTCAAGDVTSNNYGMSVYVSGAGTNYAALLNGGNVGFGFNPPTTAPTEALSVNGNIRISGKHGLKITEGTDGTMGKATLVAGTVLVNTTKVTANSRIFLMSENGAALTVGTPYVSARTAATSFTITSTSATDVSDVAWIIIEP